MKILRIATRQSPMALWQAEYIKKSLSTRYPDLNIELIKLTTQGDRNLQAPLNEIGGKSLFVKELQTALLNNEADIAVHCIKDMSVTPHSELTLTAICKREEARDAFASNKFETLTDLPANAVVGTSSPRRTCQLKAARPDLIIKNLRGNVGTRLEKLDNQEYDGIILSASGLMRLNEDVRIKEYLNFIPAIGQGALGIECRSDDEKTIALIAFLNDKNSEICINAERAVNRRLGGDCYTPVAAHALLTVDSLQLSALVGSLDGKTILQTQLTAKPEEAEQLGIRAAEALLAQGAEKLLTCTK